MAAFGSRALPRTKTRTKRPIHDQLDELATANDYSTTRATRHFSAKCCDKFGTDIAYDGRARIPPKSGTTKGRTVALNFLLRGYVEETQGGLPKWHPLGRGGDLAPGLSSTGLHPRSGSSKPWK